MYKYIGLIMMACITLVACEPDKGVVPFDYPESVIYFPAAQAGTYIINTLNDKDKPTATDPEAGAYKYIADKTGNIFEIPLAIYRSGIHPDGDISLNIEVNEDTINTMIEEGLLDETVLLPTDKYSIKPTLNLKSGERTATFSVKADFTYLHENAGKKYAFSLQITGQPNSSGLSTIVVVIDTQILIPTAAFKASSDASNYKNIFFTNSSENITACTWDFGDGNTSTAATPTHSYAADGTYQVKLTVKGLYGDEDTTSSEVIIVPKDKK